MAMFLNCKFYQEQTAEYWYPIMINVERIETMWPHDLETKTLIRIIGKEQALLLDVPWRVMQRKVIVVSYFPPDNVVAPDDDDD